jgi:hypothetical protein
VLLWSSKAQRPFVLHFPEPLEATLHLDISLNVCFRIILPRLNFLRNASLISGQNFCMCFSRFGPSYTSRLTLQRYSAKERNIRRSSHCNFLSPPTNSSVLLFETQPPTFHHQFTASGQILYQYKIIYPVGQTRGSCV